MSLETATTTARSIFQDYGIDFSATVTGDGTTQEYNLPVENVDPASVAVWEDTGSGYQTVTGDQYTVDEHAGTITLTAGPLAAGTTMLVNGKWYAYAEGDFEGFMQIAFDLHTAGTLQTWDTLPRVEEYLVGLLAVRESIWSQVVAAAREVDVNTPEGMHIPEGQRYQQLMGLIDRIDAHYRDISQQLNVGLYRIEMFNLRRVSRTTNRLVPVYVPQEFDDHNPPVRLMPPIDPGI